MTDDGLRAAFAQDVVFPPMPASSCTAAARRSPPTWTASARSLALPVTSPEAMDVVRMALTAR